MLGPAADWEAAEYLAAAILDTLNAANWQRGGGKGARPNPTPRPDHQAEGQRVGSDPIPIKDFDSWWDSAD